MSAKKILLSFFTLLLIACSPEATNEPTVNSISTKETLRSNAISGDSQTIDYDVLAQEIGHLHNACIDTLLIAMRNQSINILTTPSDEFWHYVDSFVYNYAEEKLLMSQIIPLRATMDGNNVADIDTVAFNTYTNSTFEGILLSQIDLIPLELSAIGETANYVSSGEEYFFYRVVNEVALSSTALWTNWDYTVHPLVPLYVEENPNQDEDEENKNEDTKKLIKADAVGASEKAIEIIIAHIFGGPYSWGEAALHILCRAAWASLSEYIHQELEGVTIAIDNNDIDQIEYNSVTIDFLKNEFAHDSILFQEKYGTKYSMFELRY